MDKAKCGKGRGDSGEHAHEDLHARMTEQLLELLFGKMMFVQQFIYNLIEQFGLFTRSSPDTLGIEHNDNRKCASKSKKSRVKSVTQPERSGQRTGHSRMGTGHAAGTDHITEVQFTVLYQTADHLYALGNDPAEQGGPETWMQ